MLSPLLLAQVTYSSSSSSSGSPVAVVFAILMFMVVAVIIAVALGALCFWKVLEKGGKPGWASMVPIYNVWLLFEMSGKNGALALIFLGSFIPFIGIIFSLTGSILLALAIAKVFGKDAGWVVGLVLLGIVFYPILGFGDSKYLGVDGGPQGFPVIPPQ
jgi:hypothetical protein